MSSSGLPEWDMQVGPDGNLYQPADSPFQHYYQREEMALGGA